MSAVPMPAPEWVGHLTSSLHTAPVENTEFTKSPQRVRWQHQPDPERHVRGLRLDNLHVDAAPCQGGTRAQTADPGADDQHAHAAA